jgi:hypothetical protein
MQLCPTFTLLVALTPHTIMIAIVSAYGDMVVAWGREQ